ncbi:MAG: hypothetical protein HC828_19745 [Blastochloris sp.]|nr:hypothetical protein [Blastochloris sp.]
MAVTSKKIHSQDRSHGRGNALLQRIQPLMYGVTLLLAASAIYIVVGIILGWGNVLADDLRYGRPRTFQVDAFVGHEETSGVPTHLMAINLDRQIIVIELPGGDPTKLRTIQGPYLFGADEHLTPATLELRDMDGDTALDLLLNVRDEQVVYLNRDGAFRLPTPEEQAQLKLGQT